MNAPVGPGPSTLRPGDVQAIPYTPVTNMGRELGIMFGFIGLSLVTMVVYWYFWRLAQRRIWAKEEARREALSARHRDRATEKQSKRGSNNSGGTYFEQHETVSEPHQQMRNGTSANGLFGFGGVQDNMVV